MPNAGRVLPLRLVAAPKARLAAELEERGCLARGEAAPQLRSESGLVPWGAGHARLTDRSYGRGKLGQLNMASHSPAARYAKNGLCVLLTLALAVCAAPGLATVLCISPNGHAAVEGLNALCCRIGNLLPSTSYPPSSTPGQLSQSGSCGNCTDVPVFAAADRQPAVSVDSQAAPGSPAVVSLTIQCSTTTPASATHTLAHSPISESPVSSALRSVSLRC